MISLTTNIDITKNVTRITKWEVTDVEDKSKTTNRRGDTLVPYMIVEVTLYGAGGVQFMDPYMLFIRDTAPSLVMTINASPTGTDDQFVLASTVGNLANNPYTALSAAWQGATTPATKAGRLKAVETLLVSVGALPAQFAGT